MRQHPPTGGGNPLPTNFYDQLRKKGCKPQNTVNGSGNPAILLPDCQISLVQRPCFLVETVGLPCAGKSTVANKVKRACEHAGWVAHLIDAQAEHYPPPGIEAFLAMTEYSQNLYFADCFFAAVRQVEAHWHDADIVLAEHYTGFTRTFECFGRGGKCGDIAEAVIRNIEEPDLTLYLVADPADTMKRGSGKFATDPVFLAHMWRGLEILATEKRWQRIETAGRSLEEIAADSFRAIDDRMSTRTVADLKSTAAEARHG